MGLETRVPADDIGQLHQSGIFDAAWYANQYADVAMSGMDPAEHYLWIGRRLGRKPGPAGGLADTVAAQPAQPVRAKGKVDLGWNDLPIHPDRPNRWVHNTAAIARNRAQILQPLTRSFNPTSLNIHWIVPDFAPAAADICRSFAWSAIWKHSAIARRSGSRTPASARASGRHGSIFARGINRLTA
jgi:hypothetical protein